jgi:hypothetical protein
MRQQLWSCVTSAIDATVLGDGARCELSARGKLVNNPYQESYTYQTMLLGRSYAEFGGNGECWSHATNYRSVQVVACECKQKMPVKLSIAEVR